MCRYTACRRHQRDEIKGDAARPSEPRAAAAAAAKITGRNESPSNSLPR